MTEKPNPNENIDDRQSSRVSTNRPRRGCNLDKSMAKQVDSLNFNSINNLEAPSVRRYPRAFVSDSLPAVINGERPDGLP